jgi:hypothetical protein
VVLPSLVIIIYTNSVKWEFNVWPENIDIPPRFASLHDARYCYEYLRFRMFSPMVFKNESEAATPEGQSVNVMEEAAQHIDQDTSIWLRNQISKFDIAYSHILEEARRKEGRSKFVRATVLYIQHITLEIPLEGGDPVKAAAIVCEILVTSKSLVEHPEFQKFFIFEIGIIPCLWFLIITWPDIEVKKEAISILRGMQGRIECVWNSKSVADSGEEMLAKMEIGGGC